MNDPRRHSTLPPGMTLSDMSSTHSKLKSQRNHSNLSQNSQYSETNSPYLQHKSFNRSNASSINSDISNHSALNLYDSASVISQNGLASQSFGNNSLGHVSSPAFQNGLGMVGSSNPGSAKRLSSIDGLNNMGSGKSSLNPLHEGNGDYLRGGSVSPHSTYDRFTKYFQGVKLQKVI